MERSDITVALVDDHVLLRNGLAGMLRESGYTVLFEADNGLEFEQKIQQQPAPAVVLLDINMPVKDGFATAKFIRDQFPAIRVLALSMYDEEESIIRMLKAGARGYVLKDAHPSELKRAIDTVMEKAFYYSDTVTGRLMRSLLDAGDSNADDEIKLNDREKEFLKLAATELTYKEIAEKMKLSPRTIDGYRDDLFEKLAIKSRVGLVLYAIRNGIVVV